MNIFSALLAKVDALLARSTSEFKAEIETLRTEVNTALRDATAQLAAVTTERDKLAADLTTAKASITSLSDSAATITAALNGAVAAFKLDIPADATDATKVDALQKSVSATLSKVAVDPKSIPAPGASAPTGQPAAQVKTLTLEAFNKLSPGEKSAFAKLCVLGQAKIVDQ